MSAQPPTPPTRRDLVEGWFRPDDPTLAGPAPTGDLAGSSRPPVYDPTRQVGPVGAPAGPPTAPPGGGQPMPPPLGSSDKPEPDTDKRGFTLGAMALASFVAALVAAVVGAGAVLLFDDEGAGSTNAAAPAGPPLQLDGESLDIRGVLQNVQPSVVSIATEGRGFGGAGGAGSGIVIDADGLILTNAHVIANADTMEVSFFDGRTSPAELVGASPDNDVALIQATDIDGLTPAELGSSATVRVGDEVVAIGNALNLGSQPTVTLGIVSAKDRAIEDATVSLSSLLQTDAAINPGNSGGPLVNALGEVVGVNTAIINDAQSIGFAISIDTVKPLIDQIRSGDAEVLPGQALLGVTQISVSDLSDALREEFGVSAEAGAFIAEVVPGSGAADADLEAGDVVIAIDGEEVTSSEDLGRIVLEHEPGDEIVLEIRRGDEELTSTATLSCKNEPC